MASKKKLKQSPVSFTCPEGSQCVARINRHGGGHGRAGDAHRLFSLGTYMRVGIGKDGCDTPRPFRRATVVHRTLPAKKR